MGELKDLRKEKKIDTAGSCGFGGDFTSFL